MCNVGEMFGGPSQGEMTAAANTSKLEGMYSSDFATNYGEQQSALSDLNSMLNDLRTGQTGQGFSAQELSALNTQANEGVAQNYAKAQQSLNNTLAARGGGNEYLPTGGEDQLRATLASNAAQTMSQQQLGITEANYAQGRQNFLNAISGQEKEITDLNPTQYGQLASNANAADFSQQKTIASQKQQEFGNILGTITGVASSFIPGGSAFKAISGGLGNLDSTGGSSFGEQIGNFFTGMGGGTSGPGLTAD